VLLTETRALPPGAGAGHRLRPPGRRFPSREGRVAPSEPPTDRSNGVSSPTPE